MSVSHPVFGTSVMVSTPHSLATRAALQILTAGGNAIDASIAAQAAITVVLPSKCSAAGEMTMLYWEQEEQTLHALLASGPVSHALPEQSPLITEDSPFAIVTPATVDGWSQASERFGELSFSDVLSPAMRFAQEGFPVSDLLYQTIRTSQKYLQKSAEGHEQPFWDVLQHGPGSILRQPDLAATYYQLARGGRGFFYEGEWAKRCTDEVQKYGGVLNMQDLATYASEWVHPVNIDYRNHQLFTLPPPTQGVTFLEMMNILKHLDMADIPFHSSAWFHHLLEVRKQAFLDRDAFLGDPRFHTLSGHFLNAKWARYLAHMIMTKYRASSIPQPAVDPGNTAVLAIADASHNLAVSILSVPRNFGSGISVGGVFLSNRGMAFSHMPHSANLAAPGKRPLLTLVPVMAFQNNQPTFCLGISGGDNQPLVLTQMIHGMLDHGMNIQQAISSPRLVLFSEKKKPLSMLENRISSDVLLDLRRRGHHSATWQAWDARTGQAQGIALTPSGSSLRLLAGGADPRAEGMAQGW